MKYEVLRLMENGRSILGLSLPNEIVDEIVFKTVLYDKPEFLLKFNTFQDGNNCIIHYDVTGLVPLAYTSRTYGESEILELLSNILSILTSSYDWFMEYHNFILDYKFMLTNESTKQVQLLYVPVKESIMSEEEIKSFFIQLISELKLVNAEKVVNKLLFFLIKDISLVQFQQFLSELTEEITLSQKKNSEKKQDSVPLVVQSVNSSSELKGEAVKPLIQETPVTKTKTKKGMLGDLFGKKEKARRKVGSKKTLMEAEIQKRLGNEAVSSLNATVNDAEQEEKKVEQQENPLMMGAVQYIQTPSVQAAPIVPKNTRKVDYDVTDICDIDTFKGLHLKYVGKYDVTHIDDIIPIDFINDGFRIGRLDVAKGPNRLEFEFHPSIKSISRTHARIEREGDKYFIIDLNSQNGTFINDNRINSMFPYELKLDDKVSFSNKGLDYIFLEN